MGAMKIHPPRKSTPLEKWAPCGEDPSYPPPLENAPPRKNEVACGEDPSISPILISEAGFFPGWGAIKIHPPIRRHPPSKNEVACGEDPSNFSHPDFGEGDRGLHDDALVHDVDVVLADNHFADFVLPICAAS
jgi:hypothetical protein